MTRTLDVTTLDGAAEYLAGSFFVNRGKFNRDFVVNELYNYTFKDEYEHVLSKVQGLLAGDVLGEFNQRVQQVHEPRKDDVFVEMLRRDLAIDKNGKHIDGEIGRVSIGTRIIGRVPRLIRYPVLRYSNRPKEMDDPNTPFERMRELSAGWVPEFDIVGYREHWVQRPIKWEVYSGEGHERAAGRVKDHVGDEGPGADPLPDSAEPLPVGATNPNISALAALDMADALVDRLDLGSTAAEIRGRSGTQPADPDAAESGTLLFTLPMSDPAFGNAADGAPNAVATAAAITDDSSADATGTLGYCRVASTGTGADDEIDGEAGTSASDFNFNTLSIVSGSTVSMTSFTVTMPQGATAS